MGAQSDREGRVVAALGPTNTGKTYQAVERMLEHDSGMIGFPLRLLAREVYDRLSARLGESAVALVTGEERRVPARPDYWICTVEAMPQDRQVDFLAVDEIQLAAHRERGHVFTDRLLRARGRRETWFLGSETMRDLVAQLVPNVQFERYRRLSELRHVGQTSLRTLPPRSALVAFSAAQVYELAERLRRLRGGVAVVLGALSPRTRNAQVAMYQAGEVRHLVATDAIGMGLNLDVDHVAFAGLSKFDGFEYRDLQPAEMAQIAGRAGRHVRDGSFGTLRPLAPLAPGLVAALESHRFAPERMLIWRNAELDYSTLNDLQQSLCIGSSHPALRRVPQAEDFSALRHLAQLPAVQARATDPVTIALLWQVCQVPNFRKQLVADHCVLLLAFFQQLVASGQIEEAFFEQQTRRLDQLAGDIDTLTARLAEVRTWAYVCQRPGWLRHASKWQEFMRGVEDRLGDALHQKLVERFVARQRPGPRHVSQLPEAKPTPQGPFAQLAHLRLPSADPEGNGLLSLATGPDAWVGRVEQAAYDAFTIDARGWIRFEGELLARLLRGKDWGTPAVALHEPELWAGGAQRRLQRRLHAFSRDLVAEAAGGALRLEKQSASPEARGLAYALAQALGVMPRSQGEQYWAGLPAEARLRLKASGFRLGRRLAYLDGALSEAALTARRVLASLWWPCRGSRRALEGLGAPWLPHHVFEHADQALLYGYVRLKGAAFRADIVEELGRQLAEPGWHEQVSAALAALALSEPAQAGLTAALGLRQEGSRWVRVARKRRARRSHS